MPAATGVAIAIMVLVIEPCVRSFMGANPVGGARRKLISDSLN